MEEKRKSSTLIIFIMMFGAFVGSLSQTLLAPALPVIMEDFAISPAKGQWLTTVYMLVIGIMIPMTAYLIERFKTRTLFLTSVAIFIVGSVLALVTESFLWMIISRILQAMGSGVLMPLLQVTALKIFPPEQRGFAMGIVGITIGFAPAVGPTLAGWLITNYGWHSIFLATLILGLLDLVVAFCLLPNIGTTKRTHLDYFSVVLSSVGFGGLLIGSSNKGQFGLMSIYTWMPLVIGVICLVVFYFRQLKLEEPLLDVRVFRHREFVIATMLTIITYASMMSATIIIPMYVQDVRGYTALDSGLLILPGAILMVILNPIAGRMLDKYGPRKICITGLILLSLGTIGFSTLNAVVSLYFVSLTYGTRMIGISLLLMPLTAWGLSVVPQDKISHGTAINNTLRQVAGAVGSAIFVSIMVNGSKSAHLATEQLNDIQGISQSFMASSCLAIFGLLLAIIFIKEKPAKECTSEEVAVNS